MRVREKREIKMEGRDGMNRRRKGRMKKRIKLRREDKEIYERKKRSLYYPPTPPPIN